MSKSSSPCRNKMNSYSTILKIFDSIDWNQMHYRRVQTILRRREPCMHSIHVIDAAKFNLCTDRYILWIQECNSVNISCKYELHYSIRCRMSVVCCPCNKNVYTRAWIRVEQQCGLVGLEMKLWSFRSSIISKLFWFVFPFSFQNQYINVDWYCLYDRNIIIGSTR